MYILYKLQGYHLSNIYRPHCKESHDNSEPNRVHKPHPKRFLKKVDCSNSLYGVLLGSMIFIINVVTLCLFYGLKEEEEKGEHSAPQEHVMKFKIIIIS